MDSLVNVKEFMEMTGMKTFTAYKYIQRGLIKTIYQKGFLVDLRSYKEIELTDEYKKGLYPWYKPILTNKKESNLTNQL